MAGHERSRTTGLYDRETMLSRSAKSNGSAFDCGCLNADFTSRTSYRAGLPRIEEQNGVCDMMTPNEPLIISSVTVSHPTEVFIELSYGTSLNLTLEEILAIQMKAAGGGPGLERAGNP